MLKMVCPSLWPGKGSVKGLPYWVMGKLLDSVGDVDGGENGSLAERQDGRLGTKNVV